MNGHVGQFLQEQGVYHRKKTEHWQGLVYLLLILCIPFSGCEILSESLSLWSLDVHLPNEDGAQGFWDPSSSGCLMFQCCCEYQIHMKIPMVRSVHQLEKRRHQNNSLNHSCTQVREAEMGFRITVKNTEENNMRKTSVKVTMLAFDS